MNIDGPADIQRVSCCMVSYGDDGVAIRGPRRLTQFTKPTVTVLVVDSKTGSVYINNRSYMYGDFIALWHKERRNVLFVDGPVEAVAKNGLNYRLLKSADMNDTNSPRHSDFNRRLRRWAQMSDFYLRRSESSAVKRLRAGGLS